MDMIALIGSTLGLGFVAGVRLYASVLALGLAIRFGWLHLGAGTESLQILAHPAVLTAAAIAYLAEFFADKIPWVDSVWDSFHTFIRPIGAAVIAAAVLGNINPALKTTLIILCGGVALASHSSKAATRLLVNHSPEPVSNIAVSLFEDALAPFGIWLSLKHPEIALSLLALFLCVFGYLAPRVYRSTRLQLVAIAAWMKPGTRKGRPGAAISPLLKPELSNALSVVASNASPIPEPYARCFKRALKRDLDRASESAPGEDGSVAGIRVAATKSIRGLRNSVGYLIVEGSHLAFVARRGLRYRVHRIELGDLIDAEWKRGLLMNRLILHGSKGYSAFYAFKDLDLSHLDSVRRRSLVMEKIPLADEG